uniref:Uncharacterized protein n=1 Tax=Arundo donax TaxID=35708 RepID=A0A0A9BQQ2_ARUDO
MEAAAGGNSESEIGSSLLSTISCSLGAVVVFLFLASTAVVGDKESCKSGVVSCASSGGRLRHASSAGVVEALGSACF